MGSPEYDNAYLDGANDARELMRDIIEETIAQIRRGDLADAITGLEREFWPKWDSTFDSHVDYIAATNSHAQPLDDGTPIGKFLAKALSATLISVESQLANQEAALSGAVATS